MLEYGSKAKVEKVKQSEYFLNALYMQKYVDSFKLVDSAISATPIADRYIKSST